MDHIDRKILDLIQDDATLPIATIAEKVGLSGAPCWRRIKRLEDEGVIVKRVALVDRRKVNVPMTVFVSVRTTRHTLEWVNAFKGAVLDIPEVMEVWRLTGEVDYLHHNRRANIGEFEASYEPPVHAVVGFNVGDGDAQEVVDLAG